MTTKANCFTYNPELATNRSYVKREELVAKIEAFGFSHIRHMIFQRADGRWAAVFTGPEANPVIFKGFLWFM